MSAGEGVRVGRRGRLTLVSGAVGCGKSTWVRAEMARRGWTPETTAGYRTYWVGPRGAGGHLELSHWNGEVAWRGRAGTGRPDGAGLAEAAVRALEEGRGRPWLAIDELGWLEAGDAPLREAVRRAVAEAAEAIVVVQERAREAWGAGFEE